MVRLILRIVGIFLRAYPPGQAPVRQPEGFSTFYRFEDIPEDVLKNLAGAYREIFSEEPWNEDWEERAVIEKLRREMGSGYSYLAVMDGNSEHPTAGFCWGSAIPTREIPQRIADAHPIPQQEAWKLAELPSRLDGSEIMFVDEVALLRQFRGGMRPLLLLFLPLLEIVIDKGLGIIFWSSTNSKIVPFLVRWGFQPISEIDDITVLYLTPSSSRILGKLVQNLDDKKLESIMKLNHILHRKKG